MAVAISRVTPAVIHRLQIPVQVLLYAGLFVFAQYLVSWLHLPLPANLVGMVLMLALIVCRDTLQSFASSSCDRSFPALAAFILRFFIFILISAGFSNHNSSGNHQEADQRQKVRPSRPKVQHTMLQKPAAADALE